MKTQESRTQTMSLDMNLGGEGVTRRGFMGGMAAMAAGAAAAAAGVSTAFADEAEDAEAAEAEEAEATEEEAVEAEAETEEATEEAAEEETSTTSTYLTLESPTGWTGTPEDLLALGVSTMPLEDLNQYREAYVAAQTDYTCEDGTVIPACYVKVRALINTYNFGCGSVSDTAFDDIMENFSEDDCQAFIDMPLGVEFTAYEMAAEEDRDVDECTEICERLADAGYIRAFDSNRGRCYNQVPYAIGIAEYHLPEDIESDNTHVGLEGADAGTFMAQNGTPIMYYVPVDESVIEGSDILPFDDLKEKVKSKNVACIMPCYCRYKALAGTYGHENIPSLEDFVTGEYADYFSDICDQRVETCIYTGNEAQYFIDQGMARQITGEQAAEYIQRSVDDGFMIESTFDKTSECICSCHVDSCMFLAMWLSLGDADTIVSYPAFQQVSHYTLEVETDKCIACGTCVDRCPMHIITINDEGWAEAGEPCFRCGQCAYVCPQGARHLVQRDESELAPLDETNLDHANQAASYRFETGLLTIPEA